MDFPPIIPFVFLFLAVVFSYFCRGGRGTDLSIIGSSGLLYKRDRLLANRNQIGPPLFALFIFTFLFLLKSPFKRGEAEKLL